MAAPAYQDSAMSSVVGAQANTLPISWSHTIGTGPNNFCVVAVNNSNGVNNGFTPTGTPTCTVGGQSLTWLGYQTQGSGVNEGFIGVWAGLLVPTGSQTVATSIASAGNTNGNAYGASFTYTNVGGFGSLQKAGFSIQSPSISVPSAVGDLVWGMVGEWSNDGWTVFSLTQRQGTGLLPSFLAGDTAGATSVTVSGTLASTRESAVVGLDIRPVTPKRIILNQSVQAASLR